MKKFVKIYSKEKLNDKETNAFWKLFDKFTKVNYFLQKHENKTHVYEYVLDHSLVDGQMEFIIKAADKFTDKELFYENSLAVEEIDDDHMKIMLDELAKYMHNQSIAEKTANGWRWGESFSLDDKTSPLLVTYENLPDEYRKLRPDIFSKVIDIMIKNL
jgi:hypothetical protein